ncbi:MAG: DUF5036 family protein [Muribaculaceae bacterium]|nr:DUF5036 family protein [Muribaculaceae bacterium]
MKLFKFFFLALCSVVMIGCTSDEPDNPDNGEVISPDTQVADPTGTIALSMRDYDNGLTFLGNCIYIRHENFLGGYFSSFGEVSGLGNVSYIPKTGWADRMAVIPGNGYVAYANGQYYRIYVVDYATSTLGGIIGADVKYQTPFKGVDEEIKINVSNLTFSNDGGEQGVVFENENIVVFTATSSHVWCKVERCTTHDTDFLYNGVVITVDPNEENLEDEEATVTLTTAYGKKKEIKVTRAAADANIRIVNSNSLPTELSPKQDSISIELAGNMPLYMLSTESDQEWCEVKLVNNSSRMASRAAEIKSIEGRPVSRSSVGSDAYSFVWQVSATANNSEEKREATIFLKDKSGATILTHSITQEEGYFFASEATSFPLKGHAAQDIHAIDFFSHRADYTVTSSENWCKCYIKHTWDNYQVGVGEKIYTDCFYMQIYIDLEENTEETSRSATLTFATPDNGISKKVAIEQTGAFISFINDITEVKYSSDAGNYSTWVYSSSEDIVVTSSEEWCEVTATTYGPNPDLGIATGVEINLAANETSEVRTAIITAATSDGKIKQELKVTQEGRTLNVEKTKLWFDRKNNNHTMVVTTNAATYTPISSDESWLTVSTNGRELTIRVTATSEDREGKITFEGFDEEITVIQSKYAAGNTYSENGVEGTVFYMQDSVRIMYKRIGTAAWSTEYIETGANSYTDGKYNMAVIKRIPNWQSLYPAFALVDALNVDGVTGWYFPAIYELRLLGPAYEAWSSSEDEDTKNRSFYLRLNNEINNAIKSERKTVVAFHNF